MQDQEGFGPLMYAVVADHVDTTRILLQHGADANETSERGKRLCLMVDRMYLTRRWSTGWTALMHAAGSGNEAIFEELVRHGAKLDATFEDGRTVLHLAVGHGHAKIGTP